VLADKKRRLKLIAGMGYAASAVTRLGLFLAGAWLPALLALVTIDRVGKGPPRMTIVGDFDDCVGCQPPPIRQLT
jgi:hypothetical protein